MNLSFDILPTSERAADFASIERMVKLTNQVTEIPTSVRMLGAARLAAQRGRHRIAIVELGTCLEGLLTEALKLPVDHKHTLGPLADMAIKAGVPLPTDVAERFVGPRNAAIHQGIDPSAAVVHGCLDIVDGLIETMHPDFACDNTLSLGIRPQRYDLVMPLPQGQH